MNLNDNKKLHHLFAISDGERDADEVLEAAKLRANAKAAKILAAIQCPERLREWGKIHRIANFAEMTWEAGFVAGMLAAEVGKGKGNG